MISKKFVIYDAMVPVPSSDILTTITEDLSNSSESLTGCLYRINTIF